MEAGARLTFVMPLVVVLLLMIFSLGVRGVDVVVDGGGGARRRRVEVGVILDRRTWLGNISWACMELAVEDFYADEERASYSTALRLHLRDTRLDAVDAASAGALDLSP